MDKQIVIYLHYKIPTKKQSTIDTRDNMDESQTNYAESKLLY